MKVFIVFALLFAISYAEDDAAKERPKTFQRLIPADVLRGNVWKVFNKKRLCFYDPKKFFFKLNALTYLNQSHIFLFL